MEAKFTRKEIKEFITGYFETLQSLDYDDYEGGVAKLDKYFTMDYINREDDWPIIRNREQWMYYAIKGLPCGKRGEWFRQHKEVWYYDYPDGYMIIDETWGMVVACVRTEVVNKETGEIVRSNINQIHLRVVRQEDGGLKLDREAITRIPALYQMDNLKTGEPGQPCWLYYGDRR